MANFYPFQAAQTRLVREPEYGVPPASPTYKRLNGIGLTPGTAFEIDTFAPPGALIPTITTLNDESATGSAEGRLDYNALVFVFAGLFGPPSITSLGSGAYEWVWLWDGRRPNRAVSYTAHYGFAGTAEADVVNGLVFNTITISGGRADGFDVSADFFGKRPEVGQPLGGVANEVQTVTVTGAPTGGTFALTLNGETTAPIAFDAAAADVLAALLALPTVKADDLVVAGGPLPGTPVAVTFSGYYFAGQNVNAMTADGALLTGGTAPAVGVAQTTAGADAVADVPPVPAGAVTGDVFLDAAWADLGDTRMGLVFDMDYSIGERLSRVRPMNSTLSTDDVIDTSDQEHTLALTFAVNAVERARFAEVRTGTLAFPRVQWTGAEIGGGHDYALQLDQAVLWQDVGQPGDTEGAMTRQWTGRIVPDPTSGNALRVRVVNAIDGLD